MGAPRVLFFCLGFGDSQSRGTGARKSVVVALVKGQLFILKVKNAADSAVQKTTVMADDDHRMGVFRQIGFQPNRTFKIKIVGRLIQQQ